MHPAAPFLLPDLAGSDDDRAELRTEIDRLQHQVRDLIELNTRLLEVARRSNGPESSCALAITSNRDGVWDWNPLTNEVRFSRRWKEMLGYAEGEITASLHEWEGRLHPEDQSAVFASLQAHISGETDRYETEHRLRCKDGSYRWVLDRGKIVEWTPEGLPQRLVGTHSDIHERKTTELHLRGRLQELQQQKLTSAHPSRPMVPICSCCKDIRDERGEWLRLEDYWGERSEVDFTHCYCPDCATEMIAQFVAETE